MHSYLEACYDMVRLKPICSVTETSKIMEVFHGASLRFSNIEGSLYV